MVEAVHEHTAYICLHNYFYNTTVTQVLEDSASRVERGQSPSAPT